MSNEIDLKKAKEELLLGRPIFIYDEEGRESETDIFFYAELVTSEKFALPKEKWRRYDFFSLRFFNF